MVAPIAAPGRINLICIEADSAQMVLGHPMVSRYLMKYFFPIIGAGRYYPDEAGEHFDDLAAAKEYAARLAEDLAYGDDALRGYVICIIDDCNNEVARLRVGGCH